MASWVAKLRAWLSGTGALAAPPRREANARQEANWLGPEATPFGIPVLDLGAVTGSFISVSENVKHAERAMSWLRSCGDELDLSVVEQLPPRPCDLRYPAAEIFPDGLIFVPRSMEDKWVLTHRQGRIAAARSWTGAVVAVAETRRDGSTVVVHALRVAATSGLDLFGDVVDTFDWLVRTHALGQVLPLPVGDDGADLLEHVPLAAFSPFGTRARYAARTWAPAAPSRPLRADGRMLAAVRARDPGRVRELAAQGEELDPPCTLAAYTPLHVAVIGGEVSVVRALLELGANPTARADRDNLPLGVGIGAGAPREALEALVTHGADPAAVNADGFGMLHAAAESGNERVIPWLLSLGVDVEARTHRGHTALQIASALGKLEAIKVLLLHGADPHSGSPDGTARAIAEAQGHPEAVALLS